MKRMSSKKKEKNRNNKWRMRKIKDNFSLKN
jgi:hypothetical protein